MKQKGTWEKSNYSVERESILMGLIDQHTPKIYIEACNTLTSWRINGTNPHPVCTKEDLVQEGKMAVIIAYDSYTDDKGTSLSTWIHNQIHWSMMEYMKAHFKSEHGGTYTYAVARKIEKAGKEVTVETMMEAGVSRKTAIAHFEAKLRQSSAGGASSNLRRKDDEERTKQPEKAYFQKEFENCFRLEYEKHLTDKESKVLAAYYGLGGIPRKTMEEIGKENKSSRKAISYMLNKSINKLRHAEGIAAYAEH